MGNDDSGDLLNNLQSSTFNQLVLSKVKSLVSTEASDKAKTESKAPAFQAAAAVAIDKEDNTATADIGPGALVRATRNLTVDATLNDRPNVVAQSGLQEPQGGEQPGSGTTTFSGSVAVALGFYSNTATSTIGAGARRTPGASSPSPPRRSTISSSPTSKNIYQAVAQKPNHTTNEPGADNVTINPGDIVEVEDNHTGGGDAGHWYQYQGAVSLPFDLTKEDFTNLLRWNDLGPGWAYKAKNVVANFTTYLDDSFGLDNNLVDTWSQATATPEKGSSGTSIAFAGSVTYETLNQTSHATIDHGADQPEHGPEIPHRGAERLRPGHRHELVAERRRERVDAGPAGRQRANHRELEAPGDGGLRPESRQQRDRRGRRVGRVHRRRQGDHQRRRHPVRQQPRRRCRNRRLQPLRRDLRGRLQGLRLHRRLLVCQRGRHDPRPGGRREQAERRQRPRRRDVPLVKHQPDPRPTTSTIQANVLGTDGTGSDGNPIKTVDAGTVVQAHDGLWLFNLAGGITSAANSGIGASAGWDTITRDTEAFVGDRNTDAGTKDVVATLDSGGNVIVDAKDTGNLVALSLAAEKTSSNSGQQSGSFGLGISGDLSYNSVTDTTLAYVHDATVTHAAALSVNAANPTLFVAVSGSVALVTASGGSSLGIAGSYDQNTLDGSATKAFLDNASLTLTGDCTIDATTNGQIYAIAATVATAPKSGIAVAGQVSVNTITTTTSAGASDGSSITGGQVSVTATDHESIVAVAGALAFGGKAGAGIGLAYNTITNTAEASVDGSTVGTDTQPVSGLSLSADGSGSIYGFIIGGTDADKFALTGAALGNEVTNTTDSKVTGSSKVNATGNVSLTAKDSTRLVGLAGALALALGGSGSVGIGLAPNVEILSPTVEAHIDTSAQVHAQDVIVQASSSQDVFGISVAGAYSGALERLRLPSGPHAEPNDGSLHRRRRHGPRPGGHDDHRERSGQRPALRRRTRHRRLDGGRRRSNTWLKRNSTVAAYVGDDSDIEAKGATGLTIAATQSLDLITVAVGGAGSKGTGVAGSVTVNDITDTTKAHIGTGAKVNKDNTGAAGTQGIALSANDTTTIHAVAGDVGIGGPAGVGLGVDVEKLTKDTYAWIGPGAVANAAGNLTIDATSSEDVNSFSVGGSGGNTAAVSVNAGVSVFNITTKAYIDGGPTASDGAVVKVGGNARVAADEHLALNMLVGNLSAAGTAAVGAGAAVPVVTKTTTAYIGDHSTLDAKGNATALPFNTGAYTVKSIDTRFNPKTAVEVDGKTIDLGYQDGFTEGQQVVYDDGGGQPIGGLTDTTDASHPVYYVHVVSDHEIQLSSSPGGPIIPLDKTVATGESHRIVPTNQAGVRSDHSPRFNPETDVNYGTSTINPNTINLPYSLGVSNDDPVVYSSGGGAPIGGLVNGQTYYAANVNGNSLQLRDKK